MGLPDPAAAADLPEKFRFLTTRELFELKAAGLEIGAHGDSHCHLPGLEPQRLRQEVDGAKALLKNTLDYKVDFLSYPDGVHDAVVRKHVKDAGFKAAFSVVVSPVSAEPTLYQGWSLDVARSC